MKDQHNLVESQQNLKASREFNGKSLVQSTA
jgi:hypothetical protein